MYWKIEFIGIFDKLFVKFPHACTAPGGNGIIENRTAGIWNHQFSVNSDDITKSLTLPARSKRIVKAKEVNVWRNKSDTVQFKSIGKGHLLFLIQWPKGTSSFAFIKCDFYGIGYPLIKVFFMTNDDSVHNKLILSLRYLSQLLNAQYLTIDEDSGKSLLF